MNVIKIRDTNIKIQHGDIVDLCADAIISPDTSDFFTTKGAARAIAKASGVKVRQYLRLDRPIRVGDVVVTPAGSLASKHIMHIAFMQPDSRELDRKGISLAIANCLARADQDKYTTLGIPVFIAESTPAFSFEVCAKATINSIVDYFVNNDSEIKMVAIVAFDKDAFTAYLEVFKSVRDSYLF